MRQTLKNNIQKWHDIDTNAQVLDWISDGVKIDLIEDVYDFELRNREFSNKEFQFLQSEIQALLLLGLIDKCDQKPKCVSPINCVPKKSGKYRLVTDLRKLNSQCSTPTFKNEDINTVISLSKPKDYVITADLKNGFFHVPVHADYQELLGFKFSGTYFKWTVLPFGHCSSPYFFNKVLRPIIAYFRQKGLRVVVYVDDFILLAQKEDICKHKEFFLDTLIQLGLKVNFEKSSLEPSLVKGYLGYIIDNTGDKTVIRITKDRIRKLKRSIKNTLRKGAVIARALARIAGQCVSMSKCILPGKLLLRNLYRLISRRSHWNQVLEIDEPTRSDLQWWLDSVSQWNAYWVISRDIDLQLVTDASSTGWGAWLQG